MRVAFVSMETPHTRDDPAVRRLSRIASQLADRGHDVTVLCARWWGGERASFERGGVEYRAVTADRSERAFASKLPFALRKLRPELVHAIHSPPSQVRAAKAACRLLRVPVVVDWWCDEPGDSERSYRRIARGADAVVVPSRTIKTAVREHGAAEDAVRVIPEGLDFSLVEEATADDRIDLVYSRRLDEHANVETFLLALAELRDRDWRAAVIGDGPALPDAKRTARDLRIRDRIAFVGDLPDEERIPLLKGAHVFAQTAEREPFAADLLWALACGCVGVVEYQVGSAAHELVEGKSRLEGTRGSLVSNPQELADEIVAAGEMEHRTIDPAYAAYDHGAILDRYVECYRDVVEARGLF